MGDSSATKGELHTKRCVIIDTDPGIDDAMALLYLQAHPDVELHSITTVFGNGGVETTTRNASFLADRFAIEAPIISGADRPLHGERIVPELKVHGEDGLGDTGLSLGHEVAPATTPAWQWLAEAARERPGEISILAIGPLTNLALALRQSPEIAAHVKEVVLMGGALGTHGRFGNITPSAEANFYYDPDAADAVLAAEWPVTVVGLDVTTDCVLSATDAKAMPQRLGVAGNLLREISHGYEAIYREFDGLDGFAIHDVAAAVRLTNPELFATQEVSIAVRSEGEARGSCVRAVEGDRATQRFCSEVDHRRLIDLFLATLENSLTRTKGMAEAVTKR